MINLKKISLTLIILLSFLSCGDSDSNNASHNSYGNKTSSEKWICSIDNNGSGLWTISKSTNGSMSAKGDFIKVYKNFGVVICPFSTGDISIVDDILSFKATGKAYIDLYNGYKDSSDFYLNVETIYQDNLPTVYYDIEFLNSNWELEGNKLYIEGTAYPSLIDSTDSIITPRNIKLKPTGNWNTNAVYSDDHGTIEIYLNSYCTEFHNDTPSEGQLFDNVKVADDQFLKAYSRYYNALFSICSNSNGLNLLDEIRKYENDYIKKSRPLWKDLAQIEYEIYEIKEVLFETINEIIPLNDKDLFDNIFQRALWIETDNINPEDNYEDDQYSIEDTLIDTLTFLVVNNNDIDRIESIINSIMKVSSDYEQNVHSVGLKLVNLINQYKNFASTSISDSIFNYSNTTNNNNELTSISLFEAKKKGLINYHVEGTGKYAGESLKLVINTLTDKIFNIEIPDALINNPQNAKRSYNQAPLLTKTHNLSTQVCWKHICNYNQYNYKKIKKSGSSVQSMMSVSSIKKVTLNDPNSQVVSTYSATSYKDGDILITGSDNKGTTAEDTITGSQFIINKLNNSESETAEAEKRIIEQVKSIIASGGVPSLSIPGVSYVSLSSGKIVVYCFGQFIGEVKLQYGVNYGIFDEETGERIKDMVEESPEIITDPNFFKTLNYLYKISKNELKRILKKLKSNAVELLKNIHEYLKSLEPDDTDLEPDPSPEPVFEEVVKCYKINVDDNIEEVCIKYIIQDSRGVVDILYEF